MLIYLITNTVNGKVYVGQTTRGMKLRWKWHLDSYRRNAPYVLYRAFRKYGLNAFETQVVAQADTLDQLNVLESLWIAVLRSSDPKCGYNMTFGGNAMHMTPEVRARMSASGKKKVFTKEHRENIGKALQDRVFSKEWCNRISESHIGMHAGEKHPMFGKKRPDVAKRNRELFGGKSWSENRRNAQVREAV
jgi:group I intron endonuclease